jgi:acetylornithine deacetylase/succinyl-diaminopimelate desuccinylase-like protein
VLASAAIFLSSAYGGALGIAGKDGPFGSRTTVGGMIRTRGGRIFISQDIRYGAALSWEEDLAPAVLDGADAEEWEVIVDSATDGFDLGDDAPLAARLLADYRRLTGNTAAVPYRSFGGTYARHLPSAYSVGTSFGSCRPAEIPEGHGGAHAPDEYVTEDAFLAALRILAEYVTTAADFLRNA